MYVDFENTGYGLDVATNDDSSIIALKFLDTDKLVLLTQEELSILTNYILKQYKDVSTRSESVFDEIISTRISSVESNLIEHLNMIHNPEKVDIDAMLTRLNNTVTDEARNTLDKVLPEARLSIMER